METGSKKGPQVIGFDYLPKESPTKHGWTLREGSEENLLFCEDSVYGSTLRIKAEEDLCLDYDLVGELKECKAVEFVFRSESKFSFYAVVRFRSQRQEEPPPDRVRLRYDFNSDIEVSYPEPHQDYLKENEVEYGMPVTVEQLKDSWTLTKIDLPHEIATIEDKEWEFNELLALRIKGSGVDIDVAYIKLYKESPWERAVSFQDTSEVSVPPEVTARIFLSYARKDEKKVEKLYQKLSDAGFNPWMDKKDILPGEQWKSRIPQAIRCSDFFLVCLSANSVDKRGWIQKEIKEALAIWQEMLDSDIYLVPVRLEDCEVPERLCDFQWVNLFEEDGWTRLVKAIQVGMERRAEIIKPVVQESTPFEPYSAYEEPSPDKVMVTLEEDPEQVPSEYPYERQTSQLKIDFFESGRHDLHDQEDTLKDIIKVAEQFGIWYDDWKLFVSRHNFHAYQYLYKDHYNKELVSFLDNLDRIGRQTSYEVRLLNSINALEWYPDVDSIIETIEFVIAYAEENWVWISEQWVQLDLDKRGQEIPDFGAIEFLKNRYEVFLKTIRGLRLHANRLRTSEAYLLLHSREGAEVGARDGPGRQVISQQPSAERPAPAISVSPTIHKLATLIRALHEAGEQPCTLLLGSSLSLTPEVRRAVCDSDDWEAFWTEMQQLSAAERRALMVGPLAELNLAPGYCCLAELAKAGYFDIILTANVDDALDNALHILPASECKVFCHGQTSAQEITAALSRHAPRVKAIKLRGDINAYKLPLTPKGQFEFTEELEKALERLLSQDTILVGDISSDTDIQRCIRQGEGALWVVVPEEPRPGSFLYNAKKARPKGEVISGPEAEFVSFFSALARELGEMGVLA